MGSDLALRGPFVAARVRPAPSDKLTVPAHERRRRDEEDCPALTREQPCERREQRAMGGGVPGTRRLAAQYGELMAEHGDLDVLLVWGRTGPEQFEQLTNEEEGDRAAHVDDRGRSTAPLVSARIACLHPSGARAAHRVRFPTSQSKPSNEHSSLSTGHRALPGTGRDRPRVGAGTGIIERSRQPFALGVRPPKTTVIFSARRRKPGEVGFSSA